jgi:outer membrane protein assembly factor BamD
MLAAMIRTAIRLLNLLAIALALSACSRPLVKEPTVEDYFQRGLKLMKSRDYRTAAEQFQRVKDEFPFSPLVNDAELNVAECQYLQGSYVEAIASFKDFQRMHPTNDNIPFVIYRLGLSHLEQSSTVDRDQTTTQSAVDYFRQVLMNYGLSAYAEPARQKLIQARRSLAEHEFYIGHFYFKQGRHQAALERMATVVKTYYETETAPKALLYMREAYRRLKESEKADLVDKVFDVHYPDTPYRSKSVSDLERSNGLRPAIPISFLSQLLSKPPKEDGSLPQRIGWDESLSPSTAQMKRFIAFEKGEQPQDVRKALDPNDPLVVLLGEGIKEEPMGWLAANRTIDLGSEPDSKEQGGLRSLLSSLSSPFYTRPLDPTAPMWNKKVAEEKVVMVPLGKEQWGGAKTNADDSVALDGMLRRKRESPPPTTVGWTPTGTTGDAMGNGAGAQISQQWLGNGKNEERTMVAQATREPVQRSVSPPVARGSVSSQERAATKPMVTVGIYPFRAQSPELAGSLAETVREMLSSRVQEGDVMLLPSDNRSSNEPVEESARLAGKRSGSDYVLFGTISKVGDWVTADAKLLHVPSARVVGRFGVEGSGGVSGVVPAVVKLSSEVNAKIREIEGLPRASSVARVAPAAPQSAPAQPATAVGRPQPISPRTPTGSTTRSVTSPASTPQQSPAQGRTSVLWDQAVKENLQPEPEKKSLFALLLSPFRSAPPKQKQTEGTIIPEIEEKMKNSPKPTTLDQETEDGESRSFSGALGQIWKSINPF